MKKKLIGLVVGASIFGSALAAYPQTTFTFDDIAASNGAAPIGEEYASSGIHFINHPTIPSVVRDGYVYDNANAPFGSAFSGDQFLVMDTEGGSGIVMRFDNPVDSASYHVIPKEDRSLALTAFFWNGIAGSPGFIDQGTATHIHPSSESGWIQFDTSAAAGPFDYLLIVSLAGDEWALDDLVVTGLDTPPPTFDGTGIQITGTSSNITTNVMAGDTVEFTVNAIEMDGAPLEYRFFVRGGYGEPDWGGNKWTIVQPYGPDNTVMYTFDTPGIYFLAGHVIHPGDTWVFGYPQSGIVVEVWPAQ